MFKSILNNNEINFILFSFLAFRSEFIKLCSCFQGLFRKYLMFVYSHISLQNINVGRKAPEEARLELQSQQGDITLARDVVRENTNHTDHRF